MAFSTESAVITAPDPDPDPDPKSEGVSMLENALMSGASTESQLSFGLLRLGLLGVAGPPPGLVEGSIPGKPNLSLFDTGMGAMGSIGAGTSACSSSSSQS